MSNTIYFVCYTVYYFGFIPVRKTADVRVEGVPNIQIMEHVRSIENTLRTANKNRKVLVTGFFPLMQVPELKNPE